jgi:ABC-type antimicrobial peptide transport system permease subunit
MGLGLSTLVGLVAGYLPARNASNLVVVDALRDES